MARMPHYKEKGKRENEDRFLALLKEHGNLQFYELKAKLDVSSPTLTSYIKHLEREGKIEEFRKADDYRRVRRYRLKKEKMDEINWQVGRYEAIKFIQEIDNPVYANYRKGNKAIAAFSSVPAKGNRESYEKMVRGIAGSKGWRLLSWLIPKKSNQKMAVIIMVDREEPKKKS